MSSNKLCLGLSSDYTILDTSTSIFSDSFSPATTASSALGALGGMGVGIGYLSSRAPSPLSVQLPENQILLVKDTLSAFLDADGKPMDRKQIPWKDPPEKIGWTYPYLIVLTSKGVGVWNPERGKLVQRIDLQGVTLLNDGKLLYVASHNQVWRLVPYTYDSQVDPLTTNLIAGGRISNAKIIR
jgi:Vam6/Vps39-like protein vacuolar protein sorting-associated protein 39